MMAVTRSLLRAGALRGEEPGLCLEEVNRLLVRDTGAERFVTLFYAVFNGERGELSFANAGHNAPFLLRASGVVEELSGAQLVLGVMPGARYSTRSVGHQCGDQLFLYTDGVSEALNAEREQFSEQRLQRLLSEATGDSPRGLIDRVVQAVRSFADGAPQSDDLTILAALYRGPCRRPEGQTP
jgi:sigma-B regulation protein RsbU (phosphoserine phosphatase)